MNWQRQLCGEMTDFARQQGAAAHQAARMLQHEGREMYELQEDRFRRTAAVAEVLLSEERASVENALRESRHEERHVVERMREEARSFVAHASTSFWWMGARQNRDILGNLNDANTRNAELVQGYRSMRST